MSSLTTTCPNRRIEIKSTELLAALFIHAARDQISARPVAAQSDLYRERKAMMRLWMKHEAEIRGAIESAVGRYGDPLEIGDETLRGMDGLDLYLPGSPEADLGESGEP
jgi:hypothetical protein